MRYAAVTSLPELKYKTGGASGQVEIVPNPQYSGWVALVGDGYSKIESTITWDPDTEGDGGMNVGASKGQSRWLYLYAVPSSTDDSVATVVGDPTSPKDGIGLANYTKYRYIGPVYINSTSDVEKFSFSCGWWQGVDNSLPVIWQTASAGENTGSSWTLRADVDASNIIPSTASIVEIQANYCSNTTVSAYFFNQSLNFDFNGVAPDFTPLPFDGGGDINAGNNLGRSGFAGGTGSVDAYSYTIRLPVTGTSLYAYQQHGSSTGKVNVTVNMYATGFRDSYV